MTGKWSEDLRDCSCDLLSSGRLPLSCNVTTGRPHLALIKWITALRIMCSEATDYKCKSSRCSAGKSAFMSSSTLSVPRRILSFPNNDCMKLPRDPCFFFDRTFIYVPFIPALINIMHPTYPSVKVAPPSQTPTTLKAHL